MQKEEADELSGVKLCKRENMIIMLGKYLRKKLLEKYEYYFREKRSVYEYMTAKVIFCDSSGTIQEKLLPYHKKETKC